MVDEEQKTKKALKRLVVLGRTGTGKSFLLNVLSGYTCFLHRRVRKCILNDEEVDAPCFAEGKGRSITSEVVCAKVGWRGNPMEKLIVVDVPGTDDTFLALEEGSAERARFQSGRAKDFCVKAKALEKVHAFVVFVEGQNLRCKDAAEILKTLKISKIPEIPKILKIFKILKILNIFKILKIFKIPKILKIFNICNIFKIFKICKILKIFKILKISKIFKNI